MNASISLDQDLATLRIAGELDAISVPLLRPKLDELLHGPCSKTVVDLSKLELIDSCGVGALIALYRRLKGAGREMKVRGANDQPLFILQLMRLDRVLMADDVASSPSVVELLERPGQPAPARITSSSKAIR